MALLFIDVSFIETRTWFTTIIICMKGRTLDDSDDVQKAKMLKGLC